uniref:Toxin n=1 Tax=Siphoviridae sp. ctkL423 TaxID=2823596 RepID=A0A8S5LDW1_9CAUD|nr:MAG TPA: toxin [Siphoviridae sp. ctkL423]
MAMERSGAYSINDEYPINDYFCISLIGYWLSQRDEMNNI